VATISAYAAGHGLIAPRAPQERLDHLALEGAEPPLSSMLSRRA
jgi:hypothetical protein